GIRDFHVTGVQTCALPICRGAAPDVAPVTELARSMAWSELDGGEAPDANVDDEDTIAGIGSLRARRPGERQEQERPLTLARHEEIGRASCRGRGERPGGQR